MQPTPQSFSKDGPGGLSNVMAKRQFFAWPGWSHLRFAWLLSALSAAWFASIYIGCNWVTTHRSMRVPIHLPSELSIPFIPSAVSIYMSIYVLFLAGPFIVRDRREFAALIRALALATFIGGVGFLLIPSQPAFAPPSDLGIWKDLFHFADRINLDCNMVPSLHVALSVCCIAAFGRHTSLRGRTVLWIWAVTIALSTLFTHQHHVLDVVTGWAVGIVSSLVIRLGNVNLLKLHG